MRIRPLLAPLLALTLVLLPVLGHATPPPPEVLEPLRRFDPATGDMLQVLRAAVPGLAQAVLQLGTQEVQRGGPLPQALDAAMLARLDGPPAHLPMVIYKPEPGRLPGAFIVARYKNVTPAQLLARLPLRRATMRHPLIAQYQPLDLPRSATTQGWGDEAEHHEQRAFLALDLPEGARLFGLRPSWTVLRQDTIRWPNGVVLAISEATEPTPKEYTRLQTFRDRGKQQRHLDQAYQRALEYRVGHLLVPARAASGVLRDTVHVYFVRIVPAVDPGMELRVGAPLLRWLLDHAAPQVVTGPVALIRQAFGQ